MTRKALLARIGLMVVLAIVMGMVRDDLTLRWEGRVQRLPLLNAAYILSLLLCSLLLLHPLPALLRDPVQRVRHGALLFNLAFFFAAFLFFELWLRSSGPPTDLYALTGRRPAENLMGDWADNDAFCAYKPRNGKLYPTAGKRTSDQGFISSPEIPEVKPNGITRVIFFGESSAAGVGGDLPDSLTWPNLAMVLLRKAHPKMRFDHVIAAAPGYTSFESYGRFWSRIRFLKPDIVVLNHGWNDLNYMSMPGSMLDLRNGQGDWNIHRLGRVQVYAPHWWDHLLQWSEVLSQLRVLCSGPASGEVGLPSADVHSFRTDGFVAFRTNMELFDRTASQFGVKVLVCKQPVRFINKGGMAVPCDECRLDWHGPGTEAHAEAYRRLYAIVDSVFPPSAVIDLTEMNGDTLLFVDHVHPTPAGSQAYARLVSEALARFIANGTATVDRTARSMELDAPLP
ncbi:MAG: SGNH/GDSL hydrolase family protein [Flavobacteriales bacterium]|nr:SGNH/GDSL hydrolase family protein [Flavobacteriales bacterium]